jgi:hypothetical protein
MLSIKPSIRS